MAVELMGKWEMVRLGDVCEIVSGSTPRTNNPELWDGGIKWVTPAELSGDSYFVYDTERHISEKASLKPMPAGTVLLSSRAPIGKVAIAAEPMCCNQGFKNLVCSERVHNRYLYRWLKNQTAYLNSLGRGATFKEISKTIVEEIQIPLPPLPTQQKIADILDRASTLIEQRKAQIAKLDLLVKSQFVEMFGDPVRNPMGWEVRALGEVLRSKANNGFFAKNGEYSDDGDSQVMWVGDIVNRMHSNTFNLKKINVTDKDIDKYQVQYGDLLFCRSSLNVEGIGKASMVPKDVPPRTLFECHIIRAPLDTSVCLPEFIQALTTTNGFRIQIMSKAKTATMTTISQDGICSNTLYIPPLDLQTRFADFVERVEVQKARMREGLGLMEMGYKALMQNCI